MCTLICFLKSQFHTYCTKCLEFKFVYFGIRGSADHDMDQRMIVCHEHWLVPRMFRYWSYCPLRWVVCAKNSQYKDIFI